MDALEIEGSGEIGFHCEWRDKRLNRHLVEIKDTLGDRVEAEMWDRGRTRIYEVYPDAPLTEAYQDEVAARLAAMIVCLHPIYVDLRSAVAERYRRGLAPALYLIHAPAIRPRERSRSLLAVYPSRSPCTHTSRCLY